MGMMRYALYCPEYDFIMIRDKYGDVANIPFLEFEKMYNDMKEQRNRIINKEGA